MAKILQSLTDKLAIGLSLGCIIHCLATPALLILIPSLSALHLDNHAFHFWMVIAVLPTSIYALTLGCKKHKRYPLLLLASLGLVILLSPFLLGEEYLSEILEISLTVIGASLISVSHWFNLRLSCQPRLSCKT